MNDRLPADSSARERSAFDDSEALKALEDIGLLTAEPTYRPGSILYRVIGKLPGAFVDHEGRRRTKDRWAFEIWCDLRYPKSAPEVHVGRGADIPDSDDFVRGYFFPVFVSGLGRYPGSRVVWHPHVTLAQKLERPADCALAYLWAVNRQEMERMVQKHPAV